MSTTALPLSASERWDEIAKRVKRGRGAWVLVAEGTRDRIQKTKASLTLRGLKVEVTSRIGDGSPERPWSGVRTWARTI